MVACTLQPRPHPRWEKTLRKRILFKCSVALKRYNKHMGAVDGFNKKLAATLMAMGRCKQRFQRAIFLGWLLPAIGVVNIRIAFNEVVKRVWGAEHLNKLTRARGVHVLGFDKWFQQYLGEYVMRRGVEMASHVAGGEPHFMPMMGRQTHWELPLQLPVTEGHRVDHGEPINIMERRRAIVVKRDAKGNAKKYLGGS